MERRSPGVLKRRTAVHNPDRQDASGGPRLQALFKCHVIVIGVLIASGLFELLPYLLRAYLCLL